MSKPTAAIAAVLICCLTPFAASAATVGFRIPEGYRGVGWDRLGQGLDHIKISRTTPGGSQSVHVARLKADAPYAVRAVVSDQTISSGLESTSSMCKRVRCAAAVNGDFFAGGAPVGGLAILGQALRSPYANRPQLLIGGDRRLTVGSEAWTGQITLSDLRGITLDGVNVPLRGGKISLFTAAYGKTTGNRNGTTEIGVEIVQPKGPIVLGREATIRFKEIRRIGNAPIPGSGAVIAGNGAGAQALDTIWWMVQNRQLSKQSTIQISSTNPASESIGGAPVLLKDGRRAFTIVPRGLVQGRHPRTIVGWNRKGEVLLVTIDGRQPGYADGMTLVEAAEFMMQMGATDAINLDGGGSTTFVARGKVANSPSDVIVADKGNRVARAKSNASGGRVISRPERVVATALAIIPVPRKVVKPAPRPTKSAATPALGTRFLPADDDPAFALYQPSLPAARTERARQIVVALILAMIVGGGVCLRGRRSLEALRTRRRVPA